MLLACLAFLVMRVGGAHLHQCFDGSEPENAVHFADAGLHHAPTADTPTALGVHGDGGGEHHDDVDTRVAADPLVKLSLLDPTAAACLLLAFTLLVLPRLKTPRLVSRAIRLPARPLHLRPPLRGPPSLSFA